MRRCLSLTILLLAAMALAAEEPVVEILPGFGGNVPARGGLVPVTVVLGNDGPEVAGGIEIVRPGEISEWQAVTLPPGANLRYDLLTRVDSGRKLEVRVHLGGDIVARTEPGTTIHITDPVVIACGIPNGWWGRLRAALALRVGADPLKEHRVLSLRAPDLPNQALAFDAVEMVLMDGQALAGLGLARLRALFEWTAGGGTLVILRPGDDPLLARRLREAGAPPNVLARPGVHNIGAGRVGIDLGGAEPRWARDATRRELELLLPFLALPPYEEHETFGAVGNILSWYTARRQSWGAAGFLWLLGIVAGYLVVIGPVDALFNRGRQPAWRRWGLFGLAVIVFSALAVWSSRIAQSGEPEVLRVEVVDAGIGGGVAHGETIYWLHSVGTRHCELVAPEAAVGASIRPGDFETGGAARARLLHGPPVRAEMRLPTLTSRTVDLTWQHSLPADIDWTEGMEGLAVNLPPELPARAVWLADAEGLWDLGWSPRTDSWRLTGTGRDWQEWLDMAARSEWNWHHQSFFGGPPRPDSLPGPEQLADYMLFCSLAHRRGDEPDLDDPVPYTPDFQMAFAGDLDRALAGRDRRERRLNVAARILAGDRCLLVALQPAAEILPLELDGAEARRARLTLLRLWLPVSGDSIL